MNTDPVADMLTRLRNGALAGHSHISMPASRIKLKIAEILVKEGYVVGCEMIPQEPQGVLKLELKYDEERRPALHGLKRISKPGLRIYSRAREIPRVMGGVGIAIVSTPRGLMSGSQAYKSRLGGEVLCFVW